MMLKCWRKKLALMSIMISMCLMFPIVAHAGALGCGVTEGFESGLPDGWITGTQQSENTNYVNANAFIEWSTNENVNYCDSKNFASDEGKSLCVSSDNALATGNPAIGYKTYINSAPFDTTNIVQMTVQFDLNYQNFNSSDRLELKLRSNNDGKYVWHVIDTYSEDIGGWFEPDTGVRQTLVITNTKLLGDIDTRIGWMYIDESGSEADWYAQIDNVSIACQNIDATAVSISRINTGTQLSTGLIPLVISAIVILSGFHAVKKI